MVELMISLFDCILTELLALIVIISMSGPVEVLPSSQSTSGFALSRTV